MMRLAHLLTSNDIERDRQSVLLFGPTSVRRGLFGTFGTYREDVE
jgi:hypothetical protein